MVQEQRQWEQAQQYYQQALELFVEYSDQDGSGATLYRLAQVWKVTNDDSNNVGKRWKKTGKDGLCNRGSAREPISKRSGNRFPTHVYLFH